MITKTVIYERNGWSIVHVAENDKFLWIGWGNQVPCDGPLFVSLSPVAPTFQCSMCKEYMPPDVYEHLRDAREMFGF